MAYHRKKHHGNELFHGRGHFFKGDHNLIPCALDQNSPWLFGLNLGQFFGRWKCWVVALPAKSLQWKRQLQSQKHSRSTPEYRCPFYRSMQDAQDTKMAGVKLASVVPRPVKKLCIKKPKSIVSQAVYQK